MIDWLTVLYAFLAAVTTTAAALSGVAAIMSARSHSKVQQLQVSINGRMQQLIDTAHALGIAEMGVKGEQGEQGEQGQQGEQGEKGLKGSPGKDR